MKTVGAWPPVCLGVSVGLWRPIACPSLCVTHVTGPGDKTHGLSGH